MTDPAPLKKRSTEMGFLQRLFQKSPVFPQKSCNKFFKKDLTLLRFYPVVFFTKFAIFTLVYRAVKLIYKMKRFCIDRESHPGTFSTALLCCRELYVIERWKQHLRTIECHACSDSRAYMDNDYVRTADTGNQQTMMN